MKTNVIDIMKKPPVAGIDYPRLAGKVTVKLHNVHNGKNEVYSSHNAPTNAIADIFANNYGGLMNYQSFADLYRTWLGGVLLFGNQLDPTTPNDYGIPARTSNPCRAHAGQIPISVAPYDQSDDLTRGNPDNSQTVLTGGTTKMVWEWGTSAGNGEIASLGLTHSDVGSYGCGVDSNAQKLLVPFADVACISDRNITYGDNADTVFAIDGNTAYTFYLFNDTTVHVYKTPINNGKFKLQGDALLPLTAYTSMITVTLSSSYAIAGKGGCYYHFDFTNNKLILFGVPNENGTTLYKDEIDLSNWQNQTATHSSITVTGALLWKFTGQDNVTGYDNTPLTVPTKAMIYNNHLFVYGNKGTGGYDKHPIKIFKINLSNTADISEVDTTDGQQFDSQSGSITNERFTNLGGIIVHNSFLINGDKVFPVTRGNVGIGAGHHLGSPDGIISPAFGINTALNSISACKLYLATKYNLPSVVTKTSAQSMTVTYELTEV